MVRAVISSVAYHLPEARLTNEDLAAEFPGWGAEKIADKTGIRTRRIAGPQETSADLAEVAARRLFAENTVQASEIDFVLLCTQTPDFSLPTSACLLQHRLGIPTSAGALDFNLGCSGYIYGLSLAKGLIETGQARRVLLLTGETYTKLLSPADKSVRTIFGDGGAATLLEGIESTEERIGPFVLGTDGSGGPNLVCHHGGWRGPAAEAAGRTDLWMNGPEIFNFTIKVVPDAVATLLRKAGHEMDGIDLFVFHQANLYMLEHLRKKMGVPPEKFAVSMEDKGNTVSSTIPIVLRDLLDQGRIKPGMRLMLVGFGVGYSWGAVIVEW